MGIVWNEGLILEVFDVWASCDIANDTVVACTLTIRVGYVDSCEFNLVLCGFLDAVSATLKSYSYATLLLCIINVSSSSRKVNCALF